MNAFLAIRILDFVGFIVFASGAFFYMVKERQFLQAIPLVIGSLHGAVYYAVYLVFWLHPQLPFSLQFFANWGAVFLLHLSWTGAIITWDLATDFFSGYLLDRFLKWYRGGKFA